MTASIRAGVLDALEALLIASAGAPVSRNPDKPFADVTDDGLVIMFDGDPGEPVEFTFSDYMETFDHEVAIEIHAAGEDDATRRAAVDAIAKRIGAAIDLDRTLGGLCVEVREGAMRTGQDEAEGAESLGFGGFTVRLIYDVESGALT